MMHSHSVCAHGISRAVQRQDMPSSLRTPAAVLTVTLRLPTLRNSGSICRQRKQFGAQVLSLPSPSCHEERMLVVAMFIVIKCLVQPSS